MHDREHEARSGRRGDEPDATASAPTRARARARPARAAGATTSRAARGRRRRRPCPGAKQIIATCAAAVDARRPRAPEERPARLERDDNRERREDRRQVGDDALGILARDLRDQRDEAVPERERVPGVQAAVGELGDRVERQLVELEQLPRTRRGGRARRPAPTARRPRARARRPRPRRAPTPRAGPSRRRASRAGAAEPRRGDRDDTSSASVRVSVEPSANVTASAPNTTTSDQARVADDAAHAERAREQPAGSEHDARSRTRA